MTTETREPVPEGRLRYIEGTLPHLATKADVMEVKAGVSEVKAELLRWIVGLFVVTWVGMLGLGVSIILALLN